MAARRWHHHTGYDQKAALIDQVDCFQARINADPIATSDRLEGFLTIKGNMAKRPIILGLLPDGEGAFDLAVPDGTDISLFNTLVMRPVGVETTVEKASIP